MLRYALLCLLLATPALGSAIKGRIEDPVKGHGSAPPLPVQAPIQAEQYPLKSSQQTERLIEQYPLKSTQHTERVVEQYPLKSTQTERVAEHYPLKSTQTERVAEQYPLKSTQTERAPEQRLEEAPRPIEQQPQLETLSQQREEFHQIREEAAPKETLPLRYEARPQLAREDLSKTQRVEQSVDKNLDQSAQFEQRLTQEKNDYESQQIEIKEEQRRYEEPQLVQAPVEQIRDEQQQVYNGPTKSAASPIVAPLGEAEPYSFNYQVEGSSRHESGDTKGTVRGQYTLQGADGSNRIVDYVADRNGFRAQVNTNEFGTQGDSPANVALRSSQPDAQDISLRLEGKTREFLNPPATKTLEQATALPPKPDNWQVKGPALVQAPAPAPAIVQAPAIAVQAPVQFYEDIKADRKHSDEAQTYAKGERLAQQEQLTHSELKSPEQQPIARSVGSEPVHRAPKALVAEPRVVHQPVQLRAGFQSATAHRVHRGPSYPVVPVVRPAHSAPVVPVPVVRSPPVPVVRAHVHNVHRSPVQYNNQRHPPSPVQGYRRGYQQPVVAEQPVVSNSRAAFYGTEEDHSNFERS